jgi:hypothetical protein
VNPPSASLCATIEDAMTHYMPQNIDDVHKGVGAIDDDVPVLIVPVDVIPGAPLYEVHTVR